MSYNNLAKGGNDKPLKGATIGMTYDAQSVIVLPASLYEDYQILSATPPSNVPPGATVKVDIDFASFKNAHFNEIRFEAQMVNLSGSINMTFWNPWLLMSEFSVLLNNQKIVYYDSCEKIGCQIASVLRSCETNSEITNRLLSFMPTGTSLTAPLNGTTVNAGGSCYISLPIIEYLCPNLSYISSVHGANKLSIEIRLQPATGNANTIARFISSSTTGDPWTAANVKFDNVGFRPCLNRHSSPLVAQVDRPLIPVPMYEERVYLYSNTGSSSTYRVNLRNDFSARDRVEGVYLYFLYNGSSSYSAFNDSDSGMIYSDSGLSFEIKFQSRTIVSYSTAADAMRKLQYFDQSNLARFGKHLAPEMLAYSSNFVKMFSPLTYVDLKSVFYNDDSENSLVYSGLSSRDSEIEIIVTNPTNTNFGSISLEVVLCYTDFYRLEKTGQVMQVRV